MEDTGTQTYFEMQSNLLLTDVFVERMGEKLSQIVSFRSSSV